MSGEEGGENQQRPELTFAFQTLISAKQITVIIPFAYLCRDCLAWGEEGRLLMPAAQPLAQLFRPPLPACHPLSPRPHLGFPAGRGRDPPIPDPVTPGSTLAPHPTPHPEPTPLSLLWPPQRVFTPTQSAPHQDHQPGRFRPGCLQLTDRPPP